MRLFANTLICLALLGCGSIAENEKPQQNEDTGAEVDSSLYCEEDPNHNLISEDQDCDGTLSQDDCDDNNPESTIKANDADCDSINTEYDCDDNDPNSTVISNDQDCDGIIFIDDCDDNDENSLTIYEDGDCDGVPTSDDCDDNDPSDSFFVGDCDQDGVSAPFDCDDFDPNIQSPNSGNYSFANIDTFMNQEWIYNSNNILIEYNSTTTYNSDLGTTQILFDPNDGSLLSYISEYTEAGSYGDYSYREYLYDADGNMLYYKSIQDWFSYYRAIKEFTYDSNGNLILVDLDSVNQEIHEDYTVSFVYDTNNVLLSSDWITFSHEAVNEYYTFHPNGNIETYLYDHFYYDPPRIKECTFDINGNLTSEIIHLSGFPGCPSGTSFNPDPSIFFEYPLLNMGTGLEYTYQGAECP